MGTSWRAIIAAACLTAVGLAAPAQGQLTPDRTYYGINRAAPMRVAVPDDAEGEVQIHLLEPVTAEVLYRASAREGGVDMAAMFPVLWTQEPPRLMYAQLVVGDRKVGPSVVLQPMVTPEVATGADARGFDVTYRQPQRSVHSGMRAYVDQHVVLETSKGEIELALRPDAAPNAVWNFRELVRGGFYTDIAFHRIVARQPDGTAFVAQVGDPTGTGMGGPGYSFDLEQSALAHDFGVVSMARLGDPQNVNSNGSQFFICLSREGTRRLDTRYAAFGHAVSGAEVIELIAAVPVDRESRPLEDVPRIVSARLTDAPPYGEGPAPIRPTATEPVRR